MLLLAATHPVTTYAIMKKYPVVEIQMRAITELVPHFTQNHCASFPAKQAMISRTAKKPA